MAVFDGVVLIAESDRVIDRCAYGLRAYLFSTPRTPDARFRIASLSKQSTAAVTELLAKPKRIELDGQLSEDLREFPEAERITLRQLLNHPSVTPTRTMNEIIHLTTHLPCEPHLAFEMFSVEKALESWLAPVAEVEPTVGGRFELFWEPNDRENNSTIGCRITAIERDQLIAFEWRSPKQFKHFANQADPLTHVVVCFMPGRDGTDVHLVHSGWRSSAEWEEARQWQERAWRGAFQMLEQHVNEDN